MSEDANKLIHKNLAARFHSLFRGNPRTYGIFNHDTKTLETRKGCVTEQQFLDHINGETAIGQVPIMDDGTCYFGAIDIDYHNGDAPPTLLEDLNKAIQKLDLPLVTCRSKSGGAHLYLFGIEPLNAAQVRKSLAYWASQLGYGGSEIFPKQARLEENKELRESQDGNWINLPQYDAGSEDCLRYCVEGGKRISFSYFIEIAEGRRISAQRLYDLSQTEHADAPPCIQALYRDGIQGRGERDKGLLAVGIYSSKVHEDDEAYEMAMNDFNYKRLDDPVTPAQLKKLMRQGRKVPKYSCKETPLCNNCNSKICVTRKYGISDTEKSQMDLTRVPKFESITKLTGNGVQPTYILKVDNTEINLSLEDLCSYRKIRQMIIAKLAYVAPKMKDHEWEFILNQLLAEEIVLEIPEEATDIGKVKIALTAYLNKADLLSSGEDKSDRSNLVSSDNPVVQSVYFKETDEKVRIVLFNLKGFEDHLRKNQVDLEASYNTVWRLLKEIGCKRHGLRPGKDMNPKTYWYMRVEDVEIDLSYERDDKKMAPEF